MQCVTHEELSMEAPWEVIDHVNLNIYIHNRLQQYDVEAKVDTYIKSQAGYHENLYDFDSNVAVEPYYEEIDSLIRNRINGL